MANTLSVCGFDGCGRPLSCKGLCDGHYQQSKTGEPLRPLIQRAKKLEWPRTCRFDGCDGETTSRGYCGSHAAQERRGHTQTPILDREPRPLVPGPGGTMLVPVKTPAGFVYATIDAVDAEVVATNLWCLRKGRRGSYAQTSTRTEAGKRPLSLHRLIWALAGRPDTPEIDHRNTDGLDCRRENLRAATRQQNARNQPLSIANTSGVKGVSWDSHNQQWKAAIRVNGRLLNLGRHDDIEDAAAAYEAAARRYHGEFANPARKDGGPECRA